MSTKVRGLQCADFEELFDGRPHHCAISVPDLEESIRWYVEKLNFCEDARFQHDPVGLKAAFVRRGEFRIELFQLDGAAALPASRRDPTEDLRTHGTKHIAFHVRDAKAVFDELKRRGVEFAWDHVVENDGVAAFFVRDNAGTLLEFFQPAQ